MNRMEIGNILLIVDISAYGAYMQRLILMCNKLRLNNNSLKTISYIDNYECFEQFLLVSNLLNKLPSINYDMNKNWSWETSYYQRLQNTVRGTQMGFSKKSDLPDCYFLNCCYKDTACEVFLLGDKKEEMLRDTEFEFLLELL